MTRPRIVLPGVVALACLVATTTLAADLPADVRTAGDASPFRGPIDKFNAEQVERLRQHNEDSRSARDELSRQAESTPGLQVSASFQLVYTESVIAAVSPLLNNKQSVEDRLNAAIIIARNASATKSLNMQPAVVTLLADESPAVALWGVKAAGSLLPTVLQGGLAAAREQLTSGIVNAVKNHPTSGPIVQDAYRALDLSGVTPALPAAGLNKATDAMNAILAERVNQYVVAVPTDVQVDRDPANYLWRSPVLAAAQAKQREESVQNLVNLLAVAGARAQQAKVAAERDNLQRVAEAAAGALQNIMTNMNNPAAAAAFRPFLRMGQLAPGQFQQNLQAAIGAARQIKDFAKLQDPPQLKAIEQAAGN